jgi:hypothetical protein
MINMMSSPNNLHVLGLGRAGSIVARQLIYLGVQADYTLIGKPGISFDDNELKSSGNVELIPFKSPRCELIPGYTKALTPDISVELIMPDEVIEIINREKRFLLLAPLGGYTGTMFAIKIARHFLSTGHDFTIISSYPFRFEGNKRAAIADMAINHLSLLPNFISFRLDDINKDRNLLLSQAFTTADRKMIKYANAALHLGLRLPPLPAQPEVTKLQKERYRKLEELSAFYKR